MVNLSAKPFYLDADAIRWVESTHDAMSLEQKAGQLFCANIKHGKPEEIDAVFDVFEPAACMYRALPLERAIAVTEALRARCTVPPLIAANLEKGGNGIVEEGTLLGAPMEVAATDDADCATKLATVCGREGGAVGANWAFAPIIDIDTNFRNPITNTRTFGSDPKRVKRMGVAYVREIQRLGLAASIKHFPGDGQDERDQHLVPSINDLSCADWDVTYGEVYRACIDECALTCMVGHILLPAYSRALRPGIADADILPASLSPELMGDLLRGKLGFNGLVVTDATTMAGFTELMPRSEAVPRSIAAGADMFLFALNLEEDYRYMLAGIESGVITPERLDEAVTRVLALKAALGLHKGQSPINVGAAKAVIGCEEHRQWARDCAGQAVTLVKEEVGVLPLTPARYPRILFYPIESGGGVTQYKVREGASMEVAERLRQEGFAVTIFEPTPDSEGRKPPTTDTTGNFDAVVYVANLATKSNQTVVRIEWAQPMGANCPHYIHSLPTIFISLENPYHLLDVPRIRTFINAYSSNSAVIDAVIDKLTGREEFYGVSPVDAFCGKWDTRL